MAVGAITVRLVQESDLPALHAREAHPQAHLAEGHFSRQAAGEYYFCVATDESDVPAGVGVLDCRPGKLCPELKDLWVYPEARGHGVATALAGFLEGLAAGDGFAEVFLRVDPDNETAIPVFIALDYTPTGDHVPTGYAAVDSSGVHSIERMDAVFRKSLRIA